MSASQQLLLFVLLAVPCITAVRPRIAVIGSGVGGASTAYFVRQRLPTAHITVFEKAQRTGGRTHTIDFPSASGPRLRVDAGATSISTLNRYFVAFVDQFGLQKAAAVPGATQLGIWDGQRTFFRSGEQSWKLLWNALLRWGVTPALLIHRLHDGIAKWLGIYALQQQNRSFRSPEAMFKALQLWNLTQVSAYDYLADAGISRRFIHEFVDGVSRDNYNQPGTLNAFVDLVSLAGAALEGQVFRLANGTSQISAALLRAADVELRTGEAVLAVETAECARGPCRFRICTSRGLAIADYDAVVIAAPLEGAGIRLPGAVPPQPPTTYQHTYATFVEGRPSERLMGDRLSTLLTVEDPSIPFSSVGCDARVPRSNASVYKVFSRQPLTPSVLDQMFAERSGTLEVPWVSPGAYTKLQPSPEWPSFVLQDGLVYVNAMEAAVSCMETQIVAGNNAAMLVEQHLRGRRTDTDGSDF